MTEKNIKSRIVHKHDTEENWNKAINFIPKQGELIVYDIDNYYTYERLKIGDGITTVINLPFVVIQADFNQMDETKPDFIKNKPKTYSIFSTVIDGILKIEQAADIYVATIENDILLLGISGANYDML